MRKGSVICFFMVLCLVCMMLAIVPGQGYAQEAKKILSIEAYDMLNTVPDTYLIDVRTRAEYQFVGHPFDAYLFPYMFFSTNLVIEDDSHTYQLGPVNESFVEEIGKAFKKTDNLLLIGRDGTRSRLAARALVEAGYKNVFDVKDGFEGPLFPSYWKWHLLIYLTCLNLLSDFPFFSTCLGDWYRNCIELYRELCQEKTRSRINIKNSIISTKYIIQSGECPILWKKTERVFLSNMK